MPKGIQESTPEAQREVVQRVFEWIAVTDDRVTDVDVYPVYAEAHSIGDPKRISFELNLNTEQSIWLVGAHQT